MATVCVETMSDVLMVGLLDVALRRWKDEVSSQLASTGTVPVAVALLGGSFFSGLLLLGYLQR